jgi:hypothetical protein
MGSEHRRNRSTARRREEHVYRGGAPTGNDPLKLLVRGAGTGLFVEVNERPEIVEQQNGSSRHARRSVRCASARAGLDLPQQFAKQPIDALLVLDSNDTPAVRQLLNDR